MVRLAGAGHIVSPRAQLVRDGTRDCWGSVLFGFCQMPGFASVRVLCKHRTLRFGCGSVLIVFISSSVRFGSVAGSAVSRF